MKGICNTYNNSHQHLFSTIVVNYPSSSTITIEPAAIRYDITSTQVMYHITTIGTYNITISENTSSLTKEVNIYSLGQYETFEMYYRVPAIYQEVEYISSTGSTAWINTEINPNKTTIAQIKFIPLGATGNVIFGYNLGDDTSDWRFFNYNSAYYFDAHNARINGGSCPANSLYELEIGDFYIKDLVSGNTILSGTPSVGTFVCTSSIALNGNSSFSNNTWYYVKIYNNNQLVCDLIPCYRKSDNEPGMWDTVTKRFLTNAGTGTFTVGADV